jgi:large subunit ribosomal protein L11
MWEARSSRRPDRTTSTKAKGRALRLLRKGEAKMAKKLAGKMKLQIKAGQATPSPPVGPALGQRGINIMEFCKAFNAKTADMEPGAPCPTVITYYQDKSFTMDIKTPPASYFLKKAAGLKPVGKRNRPRGGDKPGRVNIASITAAQLREIAEAKMVDLSANDVESAMKIILGSAKSMGIEVKG